MEWSGQGGSGVTIPGWVTMSINGPVVKCYGLLGSDCLKPGVDNLGDLVQSKGLGDSVIIPSCSLHISLFPPFKQD